MTGACTSRAGDRKSGLTGETARTGILKNKRKRQKEEKHFNQLHDSIIRTALKNVNCCGRGRMPEPAPPHFFPDAPPFLCTSAPSLFMIFMRTDIREKGEKGRRNRSAEHRASFTFGRLHGHEMKVLLISENRNTTHVSPFPLGLAFVVGALRRAGHEVNVLDFMFLEEWKEKLRTALDVLRPDAIGLSIRNIDNQDMHNPVFFLSSHLDIVATIRRYSNAPIVLGGAGFNIHPAGCLRYLGADLGIYGEGEEAFPLLLDALQGGEFEEVPGAVWKKNDHIIVNRPQYLSGPDRWASPAYGDFDVTAYHEAQGELPGCITIQNKRGCHMKCIYCSTPSLEGTHCRFRDVHQSVSEMASLNSEKSIRRFYVVDNVFNFPVSHAKQFCREIIARGLKVSWQAIVNPAFGDEELFELMAKAGCRFISLGNESGHELILKNLRKGFTLDNVRKAARLARENSIRYACFLLLGGPGETRDTVMQSVKFVEELSPDLVTLKAGIRIYPGTQLETLARNEGMIGSDQDLLHPVFYLSPAIREWIWDYLEKTAGSRENWKI